MLFSYILAFCLSCSLCMAQESYYYPEGQPAAQNYAPPAQQYYHEGGQYQDSGVRRSFQEQSQPQLITQVFTLPDGTIKALQVPQSY